MIDWLYACNFSIQDLAMQITFQLHNNLAINLKLLQSDRAGKSSKMSERGLLLGEKCPQSCVEEICQN